MSYEGYERALCVNGHLDEDDCYQAAFNKKWRCPVCGAGIAWWEPVDKTNGNGRETKLKVLEAGDKCRCCGRGSTATRYQIPTKGYRCPGEAIK